MGGPNFRAVNSKLKVVGPKLVKRHIPVGSGLLACYRRIFLLFWNVITLLIVEMVTSLLTAFLLVPGSIPIGPWFNPYWPLVQSLLAPGLIPIGPWFNPYWSLVQSLLVTGSIPIGPWFNPYWSLVQSLLVPGSIPIGPWSNPYWSLVQSLLVPGSILRHHYLKNRRGI